MFKFFKRLIVVASLIAFMAGNVFAANPKRELRSAWFTTVWGIDWPSTTGTTSSAQTSQKQQMIDYLDGFEATNMNGSCFQVRSMGDAMYPSKYAPWSSYLTGSRGTDPGWDPLAFFVDESHKRGLEAYVWLNPYRWSSGTAWSTSMDQQWESAGMLIAGTSNTSYKVFNPALPETRQLIVNVVEEILDNYNVDGILFDDYFYPSGGTTETSSAPDYNDYKSSGTTLSIGDWRRENVNKMVKEVYDAIQAKRPDVRFGISPAGVSSKSASKYGLSSPSSYGVSASDWQYDQIYSDPLAWLAEGTIDFISPQCYWPTTHSTAPYEELTKWWSYAAPKFGRHYYASQESSDLGGGELSNNTSGWSEMNNQILFNRQYDTNNAPGTIFYSAAYINGHKAEGFGDYLKVNAFAYKSLTPVVTWKTGSTYGKVANAAYNNGTLSWTETTNGNAIIRYTVYAMPMSVTITQAKASDGDGFAVEYLQDIVYGGTYTVDSDKTSNYWYAVCVYDGYGREHEAAIVGYPEGDSEKTTLISPINGATAQWSQTFSWSEVSNATYILEIADNSSFSTIKIQKTGLNTNSAVIDLGALESTSTYYWRVRTTQSGKLESVSDVATFVTTTRPNAPKTTLLSPANGASIEENFTFSWSAVQCDNYTLQVSTQSDFSTIKYEKTISETSHAMKLSMLGIGTFYWRVITSGSGLENAVSDIRSFTISKVDVGNYEAGYEIMIDKDNDTYSQIGDMTINSVWFRSVHNDYQNISFESNGSFNRSFCAVGDYVYVASRSENSSSATIYLRKYDGNTGEIISDIILGDAGKVAYYPCNTVLKDSQGNICIANLSLNISSTPIVLHKVDLETGNLTQLASLTYSGTSSRCDHVSLTGDVTTGNFKVYAGLAKSKRVVRWSFTNGTLSKTENCSLKSYYPSGLSYPGTAPLVIPIDDNTFFFKGGDTQLAKYSFTSGSMLDSFNSNQSLLPESITTNGCAWFDINGSKYVVYPCSDQLTGGYKFNLVKTDASLSFSGMSLLWTLPKDGMGAIESTTYQALADYVQIDNGYVRVFVFVPGNGLCAYDLIDTSICGVDAVGSQHVDITEIARYDLFGRKLSQPVSGINIVKMSNGTTRKVIVK